jgi:hypothetical protein
LLSQIARGFDRASIPYMVIGGQAVAIQGRPRYTDDVDVTIGLGFTAVARVVEAIQPIGLCPVVPDPHAFVRQTLILPCQHSPSGVVVDFAFTDSPYELQAIGRAYSIDLGGQVVKVTSPEDLAIQKVIAGRPHDHKDVAGILTKHDRFDREYVRGWLRQFEEVVERPLVVEFDRLCDQVDRRG